MCNARFGFVGLVYHLIFGPKPVHERGLFVLGGPYNCNGRGAVPQLHGRAVSFGFGVLYFPCQCPIDGIEAQRVFNWHGHLLWCERSQEEGLYFFERRPSCLRHCLETQLQYSHPCFCSRNQLVVWPRRRRFGNGVQVYYDFVCGLRNREAFQQDRFCSGFTRVLHVGPEMQNLAHEAVPSLVRQ